MARGKKWTIPFVSLNGTSCRVDIYEEGYSGSVTELSSNNANAPGVAAAEPFVINEDDSTDLTNFIRFKTGSLRMIETTYGGLSGLMPRSLRDHFVEAWYGSERVFSGFMQCQEFDNDWVAVPRELEFPVISPLGLLDAFEFTPPSEPGLVTLGSLMQEVMIKLNPAATNANASDYTDVIYPMDSTYAPWDNVIHSTVMCPLNSEFKHYDDVSKLYSPKDFKYFIEGICACLGWTVHDTPSTIVFAKYDHSDPSSKVTVAGLTSLTGREWVQQRSAAFGDYYDNCDANAMQSVVMPVKKVNLNLQGVEIKDKALNTIYATVGSLSLLDGGSNYRAMRMTKAGPTVDGNWIGTAIFTTAGEISNYGLFPIAYGKIEQDAKSVGLQESWVIHYDTSWSTAYPIITAKFFGQVPKDSNGNCLIKLKIERGSSLQDMKQNDYTSFLMNMVIKSGGKYYNLTNDTWANSLTLNAVTIDGSTGKVTPNKSFAGGPSIGPATSIGDVDGIMFVMPYKINDAVEVSLYHNSNADINTGDYLRITELSINDPGAIDEPYNTFYRNQGTIEVGNNNTGVESKEITVNFNDYSYNGIGENSFGDHQNGPGGNYPTFPYLFAPMTILMEKVKRTSAPTFNEYGAKWSYWITGWRWRMIAKNFNLRDDEYQITLARSSTIE